MIPKHNQYCHQQVTLRNTKDKMNLKYGLSNIIKNNLEYKIFKSELDS